MAQLKVSIKEELNLLGVDRGSSTVLDRTVSQVDNRVAKVNATESDILKFGSSVASGQMVAANVEYLRITSVSAGASLVNLRILGDGKEYFVQIAGGESFILFNADAMDANDTGSEVIDLTDIQEIKAVTSTGTVTIEIFVAST